MANSRGQPRFLCSELVTAEWRSVFDHERTEVVNLEEIWESGATLQFTAPVRAETPIRIVCRDAEFLGRVSLCRADFIGYVVEIEFVEPRRWSRGQYLPEHFFDPASLLPQEELKEKNADLLEECTKDIPCGVA